MVQLTIFTLALAAVLVTAVPATKRTLRTAQNIADLDTEWEAACVVGGDVGMCEILLAKRCPIDGNPTCGDNGRPPPRFSTPVTTTIPQTAATTTPDIPAATSIPPTISTPATTIGTTLASTTAPVTTPTPATTAAPVTTPTPATTAASATTPTPAPIGTLAPTSASES